MAYSVFLSHSSINKDLVEAIRSAATQFGIDVYTYDQDQQPRSDLPEKLVRRIEAANAVVVLLTQAGAASPTVNEEIGIAKHANKLVIPVVEEGIDVSRFTFIQGLEYLTYDRSNPQQTVTDLAARLVRLQQKEARYLMIFLVVIGGIILWANSQ